MLKSTARTAGWGIATQERSAAVDTSGEQPVPSADAMLGAGTGSWDTGAAYSRPLDGNYFFWCVCADVRHCAAARYQLVGMPICPARLLTCPFGVQLLVENLFLSSNSYRCPYCGPTDDDFGRVYCAGASSCAEFFFPASQDADFAALFRIDVRARCRDAAGEGPLGRQHPDFCGGGGNASCFRGQWGTGFQVASMHEGCFACLARMGLCVFSKDGAMSQGMVGEVSD
jgi:hypothetical protein